MKKRKNEVTITNIDNVFQPKTYQFKEEVIEFLGDKKDWSHSIQHIKHLPNESNPFGWYEITVKFKFEDRDKAIMFKLMFSC